MTVAIFNFPEKGKQKLGPITPKPKSFPEQITCILKFWKLGTISSVSNKLTLDESALIAIGVKGFVWYIEILVKWLQKGRELNFRA